MKHIKIMQDLLKMADARDGWKHGNFDVPYFLTDDKVFVCPSRIMILGIPKPIFYFDIEKLFKSALPLSNGEKIIKNCDDAELATNTHTLFRKLSSTTRNKSCTNSL